MLQGDNLIGVLVLSHYKIILMVYGTRVYGSLFSVHLYVFRNKNMGCEDT